MQAEQTHLNNAENHYQPHSKQSVTAIKLRKKPSFRRRPEPQANNAHPQQIPAYVGMTC